MEQHSAEENALTAMHLEVHEEDSDDLVLEDLTKVVRQLRGRMDRDPSHALTPEEKALVIDLCGFSTHLLARHEIYQPWVQRAFFYTKPIPTKSRPTHFLSLRVCNPTFVQAAQAILESIKANHPQQVTNFIAPSKYHLTLFVVALPNKQAIDKCLRIFNVLQDTINECLPSPPVVPLRGLDCFGDRVVFSAVPDPNDKARLENLARRLHKIFHREAPELLTEEFRFTPHITLMKQKFARGQRRVPITPSCYADFKDVSFGEERFQHVELLAMSGEDSSGHYQCLAKLPIGVPMPL